MRSALPQQLVPSLLLTIMLLLLSAAPESACTQERLIPEDENIELNYRNSVWQLLVSREKSVESANEPGVSSDKMVDATRVVQYRSTNEAVATVDESGIVRSVADGTCRIELRLKELTASVKTANLKTANLKTASVKTASVKTASVEVVVKNSESSRPTTFERDVVPILSRFGCNSSGCHGKAEGQNGFKLSVFGFDPNADFNAIAQEGRGRRIFPAAAEQSLLLQKISGQMPHGGGVRIETHRAEFDLLRQWIATGATRATVDTPTVERIEFSPRERIMGIDQSQVTQVTAFYSEGTRRDVTSLVQFHSNRPAIANVDEGGFVTTGTSPGTAAIMATFMGHVDVFHITVPQPGGPVDPAKLVEHNYIDRFVNQNLQRLNIGVSGQAGDSVYLRRIYLDLIGTLPTPEEAKQFLDDTSADRRQQLAAALLARPEFADYWALKWADLLHVNRGALGHKNANLYYRWIHKSFASNMPFDEFA
ncbi:MAG: hypothetical protein ACI9HK_004578, partial [Pirellulaceae bacterium]